MGKKKEVKGKKKKKKCCEKYLKKGKYCKRCPLAPDDEAEPTVWDKAKKLVGYTA